MLEEHSNYGQSIPLTLLREQPAINLLVSTPTPQPMALIESVYADLDLSLMLSTSTRSPDTTFLTAAYRAEAYTEMAARILEGRQGIIILPNREDGSEYSLKIAMNMAQALHREYFKDAKVVVYCSEMSKHDRLKVFREFQQRRLDVLVCTTQIEDTPTISNVASVVVEMAEQVNLPRLHRIRGHLGR